MHTKSPNHTSSLQRHTFVLLTARCECCVPLSHSRKPLEDPAALAPLFGPPLESAFKEQKLDGVLGFAPIPHNEQLCSNPGAKLSPRVALHVQPKRNGVRCFNEI